MAEVLVSAALSSVLPKLKELLKEQYKLNKRVKNDVESLQKELVLMNATTARDVAKHGQQVDKNYRIWANQVRDMSHDTEDLLDSVLVPVKSGTHSGRAAAHGLDGLKVPVKMFRKSKQRREIADAIKNIKDRVRDVAAQRDMYMTLHDVVANPIAAGKTKGVGVVVASNPIAAAKTSKDLEDVRSEEVKELTRMLIGDDEGVAIQKLKTVSILGFGGLGKTTLAKQVYGKLKSQFDCTAFVSLSPNPDMKRVFNDMLHQLHNKDNTDLLDEKELLICKIREAIQDKRYLIVIDDIWDTKAWEIIRFSLFDSNWGSRIITTTRMADIAATADDVYKLKPLSPDESRALFVKSVFSDVTSKQPYYDQVDAKADGVYNLKGLSPDESRALFVKRLFNDGTSKHPNYDQVDEVCEKVLQKCGGIPLIIITFAGLLANKEKKDWPKVYSWINFAYGDNKDVKDIASILSFNQLPLHINQYTCLLYLATSSKEQKIERGHFVRKWIAEGFVSEDGWYSREEVANQYFDELVNKSMIQPVGHDVSCLGEETYEVKYGMHDVLRLMLEQEHSVTFLPGNGISNPSVEAPVRLFMQYSDSESRSETEEMDLSLVRSVTMHGSAPADVVSFKHLEYIRVLDLDGYKDLDSSAMDDICRLIHLKYLGLKQTQVTELPSQIAKLIHLETLDVRQTRVEEVPQEVVQLPRLAHLLFGQGSSFGRVKLPEGSNQLKLVKVLGAVDSRECSASVMEEISELKQVREISLVLHDGPADKEWNDKLLSSIGKCGSLRLIEIYGDSSTTSDILPVSPRLPLLDELKVVGTFVKVPRWVAQLRTIQKLQMRVSKLEPNDLIILGGLPGVKSLDLALVGVPRKLVAINSGAGFRYLKVFSFDCRVPWVTFEQGAMPRLEHLQLTLYVYPEDKSPSGIMHLQSLNKVTLRYSSQYASTEGIAKTVAVVREEADSHGNLIQLSVNGADEYHFLSKSKAKVDTVIEWSHTLVSAPIAPEMVDTVITPPEVHTNVSELKAASSEIEEV